jgi:hypothetical protein
MHLLKILRKKNNKSTKKSGIFSDLKVENILIFIGCKIKNKIVVLKFLL